MQIILNKIYVLSQIIFGDKGWNNLITFFLLNIKINDIRNFSQRVDLIIFCTFNKT